MIPMELVKMNANLPAKLAELAGDNPEKALEILKAWGKGTKTLRILWAEVMDALDAATSFEIRCDNMLQGDQTH